MTTTKIYKYSDKQNYEAKLYDGILDAISKTEILVEAKSTVRILSLILNIRGELAK